ncbi:hypothetical protein CKO44_06025 [Rubrivivax gelatinosus]|uniref:hypothetical protein n=1 Tax=Rubrivivax gelatinosus TaxID=28068 RepID=UPI001903BEAF|nr:hypothetical protein [Rubrivivax gelatinosus]MBK1613030.1 hypothetical protein [Rubrivivax gelatinosus]MBZ8142995.1 hypothetical protein [Rubrivivax gelatinosus]
MEAETVAAIITGITGVVGVVVGSFIPLLQTWWSNRSKVEKDTAYLAVMVVAHLDQLANGCVACALDDGTEYGRPAGKDGIEHVTTTSTPDFKPFDINVDWKVLPRDLMYAILDLPNKSQRIQNRLAGLAEFSDDFPDHGDFFSARQRGYADLSLQVFDIARKLREHAGMPFEQRNPDDWDVALEMRERIKKIDEAEAAHRKRLSEQDWPPTPSVPESSGG